MTVATATASTVTGPTAATSGPAARPHLRAVTGAPTDFSSRAAAAGLVLDGPLRYGPLVVDLASYLVTLDGEPLDLSARQVELLAVFFASPHKVWSRDQLHWLCWGDTAASRRVDVQLCRLRGRTGVDLFRNVRDRGWSLRAAS